ncbi:MAG: hypothetical protein WCC36_03650 [Gammaproteobacteria bacterium]
MKAQPSFIAPVEADSNRLKRLELIMQDALDGLEQMALLCAWNFDGSCMEILAVEEPDAPARSLPGNSVIPFPNPRRTF